VAVWRRLKKMGAVQIKTSTYLLPDEPAQYEQFQWLAQQIRDYGGDSTLVRAQEIEGLTSEKAVAMFNEARARDYVELRRSLQSFIGRRKKMDAQEAAAGLGRLTRQFREIRAVDFFDSPRGHDIAMLLRRAEGPRRSRQLEKLDAQQYQGKTWLTRPRPEIDRVGSAWLISKFIDRKPKFVFAPKADSPRCNSVRYARRRVLAPWQLLYVRNAHKALCDYRQISREDWRDDSRRRPRRCEI